MVATDAPTTTLLCINHAHRVCSHQEEADNTLGIFRTILAVPLHALQLLQHCTKSAKPWLPFSCIESRTGGHYLLSARLSLPLIGEKNGIVQAADLCANSSSKEQEGIGERMVSPMQQLPSFSARYDCLPCTCFFFFLRALATFETCK